jgi:hypothetical protein
MKKCLVFASLMGFSSLLYAALPEQPWLIYPTNGAIAPTNLPAFFQWQNSKGAGITNYRLVVSTDAVFSDYNEKTASCNDKTTCFTTTTKNTNYLLPKTATILKTASNYFWRVEAINGSGTSVYDVRSFSYGTPTTPIDAAFAVASPKVTGTSTDIATVESGKPIKISAILDEALPAGFTAKVDYGTGLIAMSAAGTGADLSATLTKVGNYPYTVGIYDDKNILKSNKLTSKFTVSATAAAPGTTTGQAPVLKLVSDKTAIAKVTPNTAFSVKLSATDVDANLKQIVIEWGDGSSDTISATDGVTRSLTHVYSTESSFDWKATAYDSSGLTSNIVSEKVAVAAPVVATLPGSSTTTTPVKAPLYKALDSKGADSTSSADWACTQDLTSNLLWETKTNDGYLHDKDWTYSWFEPDTTKNGGYAGVENGGKCSFLEKCNTNAFIEAVNTEKLCGKDTWRLPTKEELEGLVFCSDEKSTTLGANVQGYICTGKPTAPTIDTNYFPNASNDWFWTSNTVNFPIVDTTKNTTTTKPVTPVTTTPVKTTNLVKKVVNATSAWNVIFYNGYSRADNKANAARVRLVSGGASKTTAP